MKPLDFLRLPISTPTLGKFLDWHTATRLWYASNGAFSLEEFIKYYGHLSSHKSFLADIAAVRWAAEG